MTGAAPDPAGGPNADQAEHWNRVESPHWVEAADRYDAMLRPLGELAIDAVGIELGDRVLDIGCGCGQTTVALAGRVGPDGTAVGIDVSERMLAGARQAAGRIGLPNVAFEVADAQIHPFREQTCDVAFSRFGVMFFADPVAAFANVRRALRPRGRLGFVCWRELAAQEWLMVPAAAALAHVPMPDIGKPDGPGMFALADDGHVRSLLDAAGFAAIETQAVDTTLAVAGGGPLDEVVPFIEAGSLGRSLLEDTTPDVRAAVVDDVRGALEPFTTAAGVVLGAAVWIATARAPE